MSCVFFPLFSSSLLLRLSLSFVSSHSFHPLPLSLSLSLSFVPFQTAQRNCYSQVIILFVRLHSAVNPLGIPLYSLLTLLQSSFSCQSQNIAEGEKRNIDEDKEGRREREEETETQGQKCGGNNREKVRQGGWLAAVTERNSEEIRQKGRGIQDI